MVSQRLVTCWWLLFAFLVILCHTTQGSTYNGPGTGCNSTWPSTLPFPSLLPCTWCVHQNPYATVQQVLSEFVPFETNRTLVKCDANSCKSIIAMVPNGPSFLAMAFVTGEITLTETGDMKTIPVLAESFDDPEEERLMLDFVNFMQMMSVSSKPKHFRLSFIFMVGLQYFDQVHYDLSKDIVSQIVHVGHFIPTGGNLTFAVMVYDNGDNHSARLLFFDSRSWNGPVATWRITGSRDIRFTLLEHIGNYTSNQFMNTMSLNTQATNTRRNLIVIYDNQQVRIIRYTKQDLTIDLTDRQSAISRSSTFYTAPEDGKITTVSVFLDSLRRSVGTASSCEKIQFQISRSVYLHIGLERKLQNSFQIVSHLIHEFSFIDYSVSNSDVFNPAYRATGFHCYAGQYFDTTTNECINSVEHSINVPKKVTKIVSRFIDVPDMNNVKAYNYENRLYTLNVPIVCQVLWQYIPDQLRNAVPYYGWVSACQNSVSNLQCEADLLNGKANNLYGYLDAFFYNHWKTQIYATHDDNSISVHSQTIKLDNEFGNFDLTPSTTFQTPGTIVHFDVSTNGMHMFTSILRPQWEIDSMNRFVEICDALASNPDDMFLKNFTSACRDFHPKPLSFIDYAFVSSSCARGVSCSSFSDTAIQSKVTDGLWLYRNFITIPCPVGSFCVNGIRQDCPPGFICPSAGLKVPEICDVDGDKSNEKTCYGKGLSASIDRPTGTLAATTFSPPIPIPPGKALLKQNEIGQFMVSIYNCTLGDYCPLAREVSDLDELLCPANTYCPSADILAPGLCELDQNGIDYCPTGTIRKTLCPAGFYCDSLTTKHQCNETQYCPAGSFMYNICAEGYYCPNATVQLLCPRGHYCRAGTVHPTKCFFFFSHCKPGSVKDSLTPSGVALVIIIVVAILLSYLIYYIYSTIYRSSSSKKRKMQLAKLRNHDINSWESYEINSVSSVDNTSLVSDPTLNAPVELQRKGFYMDLRFRNLGLIVKSTGQRVLEGVTGEIKHGQLTCILGASGAGKTSFITTLASRAYYGRTVGEIFVNGKKSSLTRYNRSIGFVRQDDIMLSEMTVEETLYFAARTRLDWSIPRSEVMKIVDNVIDVLKLNHIRHQLIGDAEMRGISGGQRKRVNVGIELVSQPVALLCDEPTSGLDSASSKELCEALQRIAHAGVNTICVIHQPRYEIFEMFEQLLLLGEGGRTVYLGPVDQVEKYFEELGFVCPARVNPADFLMDVTSGNVPPAAHATLGKKYSVPINASNLPIIWEEYLANKNRQDQEAPEEQQDEQQEQMDEMQQPLKYKKPSLSFFVQFWMCYKRAVLQQLRSIPSLMIDLLLVVIAAVVSSIVFRDKYFVGPPPASVQNMCPEVVRGMCEQPLNDPLRGLMTMINLAIALCATMAGLKNFGREKLIFNKESEAGISTIAYFIAKDLSVFPLTFLGPLLFVGIFYSVQEPMAPFYVYLYSIFLIYWTAYGLGYIISILFTPSIAQLAAVVIVICQNTLNGMTPRFPEIQNMAFPLNILPYCSFLFFAQRVLYIQEIRMYKTVYDISGAMSLFGFKESLYVKALCVVMCFGFTFRFLAMLSLMLTKPNNWLYRIQTFTGKLYYTAKGKIFKAA